MNKWLIYAIAPILAAVLAMACSSPLGPELGGGDQSFGSAARAAGGSSVRSKVDGPVCIEGEIGPGALYSILVPETWNGDLVLYAHGYVDPALPVALPPLSGAFGEVTDQMLATGFAVARSSFSENGWAVKDAVIRTRQLIGVFRSKVGNPDDVFITGHSLGGIITLMLAEKNPALFAGAMPMSSLVGGAPLELAYIANVRLLFDLFFPGVIRGSTFDTPDDLDFYGEVVPAVMNLFSPTNPEVGQNVVKAMHLASVDQVSIQYHSLTELATAMVRALAYQIIGVTDMIGRTHDHIMTDNTETDYTINGVSQPDINAMIERYPATPDAEKYVEHYYQPKGDLRIPVLTLHKSRDPDVPIFHEYAYAETVAQAGRSEYLFQRTVYEFGHSDFSYSDQIRAFEDLVNWVKTGAKPTQ